MARVNLTTKEQGLAHQEADCLRLLAMGKNTLEIAIEKQRSEFTINFFLKSARKKLHAKSNAHAVALAYHKNLL